MLSEEKLESVEKEWKKIVIEYITKNEKSKVKKESNKNEDVNSRIMLKYKENFHSISRDCVNIINNNLAALFPERFFVYDYHKQLCVIVKDMVNNATKELFENEEIKQEDFGSIWENGIRHYCNRLSVYELFDAEKSKTAKEQVSSNKSKNNGMLMVSFISRKINSIYRGGGTSHLDVSESDLKGKYADVEKRFSEIISEQSKNLKKSGKIDIFSEESELIDCIVRYIYYVNGWAEYNIKEPMKFDCVVNLYKDILCNDSFKQVIRSFYSNATPISYFRSERNLKKQEYKENEFSKMYKNISDTLLGNDNREMYDSFLNIVGQIVEAKAFPLYAEDVEKYVNRYYNFGIEFDEILCRCQNLIARCKDKPLVLQSTEVQITFMKMLDSMEKFEKEMIKNHDEISEDAFLSFAKKKILESEK